MGSSENPHCSRCGAAIPPPQQREVVCADCAAPGNREEAFENLEARRLRRLRLLPPSSKGGGIIIPQ